MNKDYSYLIANGKVLARVSKRKSGDARYSFQSSNGCLVNACQAKISNSKLAKKIWGMTAADALFYGLEEISKNQFYIHS